MGAGKAIVTVGEAMLRFTPPPGQLLEAAALYSVHVGGSEANVAAALARLGVPAIWLSALPANPLGRRVAGELRLHGVDVSRVVWVPDARLGLYFYEPGSAPRPPQVLYDRADSAFACLDPQAVDWGVLEGAGFLHVSGITAAVNPALAQAAVAAAKRFGTPVSLDVNYRGKLWSAADARKGLEPLAEGVGLLCCSRADAELVFGVRGEASGVASELGRRFGARWVAVTDGSRGAAMWSECGAHWLPAHPAVIVDRLGAGDAFAAGVLFGLITSAPAGPLACGLALAAWKLSHAGDVAWCSPEALAAMIAGEGGGRWR